MRLDLDNPDTFLKLLTSGVDPIAFRENNSPVDVCRQCYSDLEAEDDVAHPPYREVDYRCVVCQKKLTDEDN